MVGKTATKGAIDGGSWLIKQFGKQETKQVASKYRLRVNLQLFAEEKSNVAGNQAVIKKMSLNACKYKTNLEYDCSEIAEDLAQAAGDKGEIITITSSEKYGTINVTEYGEAQNLITILFILMVSISMILDLVINPLLLKII